MKLKEIGALAVLLLFVLIFTTGCPNKPPDVPVIVQYAESTYTRAEYVLLVSTVDPNKHGVYYIMDWGDGVIDTFPSDPEEEPFTSGDTVPVSHLYQKWAPPNTPVFKNFEIKASAKDEKGKIQNNWSVPITVRVIYNDEPNRPEIFQKNEKGAKETRQIFKARAVDEQGDSVSIRFNFSGPGGWSPYRPSGDTIYGEGTFKRAGTQKVWAIAKDIKGSQSISSETLNFEVLDEGYIKGVFHAMGLEDTSEIHSSPAIATIEAKEKLFIGSEYGYAYIIDAATMRQEQRIRHYTEDPEDEEPWGNSPAVDISNGLWYMANDQGYFYCLGIGGRREWVYPGPDVPVESLAGWSFTAAAIGSHIYVLNDDEDTLYALNKGVGSVSVAWRYYRTGVDLVTAPIIDGENNLYIGDDSGYVHKLNASNGQFIWKKRLAGPIPTSGAVDVDNTVYFGANPSINGYMVALSKDSIIKWSYEVGENVASSPVIYKSYVYFGDEGGKVHAVNTATGSAKLGFPLQLDASGAAPTLSSTPAFALDDYFYIMTEEQSVFCIGIDGKVRWETMLPYAAKSKVKKFGRKREEMIPSPVIGSDGDIYVAGGEFEYGLYKLQGRGTGGGPATGEPWPMFQHDRNHSGNKNYTPGR
ncbi:MAG: PQQ-binding-like beta-propeller repeat protein [candidate division WOR-3 bacterium]|nr:PQQ-binding-like beta-propeller repeat protein [candidate division WOR-3 bacterium]